MATPTEPNGYLARFRRWYDYERDCNAKVMAMLESVPAGGRSSEAFVRALDKAAHVQAARLMWLHRLGACAEGPESLFPEGASLGDLAAMTAGAERNWVAYLGSLTEADVLADVEWIGVEDKRYRHPLIDLLTQLFGHAWYHRGQIATLVKEAGGTPVNTDFVYWDRPTPV